MQNIQPQKFQTEQIPARRKQKQEAEYQTDPSIVNRQINDRIAENDSTLDQTSDNGFGPDEFLDKEGLEEKREF